MGRVKAEKVSLATRAERLAKIKVEEINGVLCTTSLNVAEVFGKEHRNITQAIDNVIKKWVEIGLITSGLNFTPADSQRNFKHPDSPLNFKHPDSDGQSLQIVPSGLKGFDYTTYFIESTYVDERGKTQRMWLLTEKGFHRAVMGLTGIEAELAKIYFTETYASMKMEIMLQLKKAKDEASRLVEDLDFFSIREYFKTRGIILTGEQCRSLGSKVMDYSIKHHTGLRTSYSNGFRENRYRSYVLKKFYDEFITHTYKLFYNE